MSGAGVALAEVGAKIAVLARRTTAISPRGGLFRLSARAGAVFPEAALRAGRSPSPLPRRQRGARLPRIGIDARPKNSSASAPTSIVSPEKVSGLSGPSASSMDFAAAFEPAGRAWNPPAGTGLRPSRRSSPATARASPRIACVMSASTWPDDLDAVALPWRDQQVGPESLDRDAAHALAASASRCAASASITTGMPFCGSRDIEALKETGLFVLLLSHLMRPSCRHGAPGKPIAPARIASERLAGKHAVPRRRHSRPARRPPAIRRRRDGRCAQAPPRALRGRRARARPHRRRCGRNTCAPASSSASECRDRRCRARAANGRRPRRNRRSASAPRPATRPISPRSRCWNRNMCSDSISKRPSGVSGTFQSE